MSAGGDLVCHRCAGSARLMLPALIQIKAKR
jgi:hypothetical protein